jgi:uncharacterized membrane protein
MAALFLHLRRRTGAHLTLTSLIRNHAGLSGGLDPCRVAGMTSNATDRTPMPSRTGLQRASRIALGAMLLTAGIGHLTFLRRDFQAQVPDWVPIPVDDTVVYSGVAEIVIGTSLILAGDRRQAVLGQFTAAFFAAVFPGNVSQWLHRRDAFGLDTDARRFGRLFFQPALIYWALKSTEPRSVLDNPR